MRHCCSVIVEALALRLDILSGFAPVYVITCDERSADGAFVDHSDTILYPVE